MKLDTIRLSCLALLLLSGSAASADEPQKQTTRCIRTYEIDPTTNTDTPDDRTMIFHMRNGDVWRNDLINSCPGLRLLGGYSFVPTNPGTNEICGNVQSVRLNSSGAICMLGEFTRMPSKPRG